MYMCVCVYGRIYNRIFNILLHVKRAERTNIINQQFWAPLDRYKTQTSKPIGKETKPKSLGEREKCVCVC